MHPRNLAYSFLSMPHGSELWIVVINTQRPSNEAWAGYLDALKNRLNDGRFKTLVYTDGGGPNAAQRKALIDMVYGAGIKSSPTCMVSASALMRGLATALSWFNPHIKAVNPEQLQEAYHYLEVPASMTAQVTRELKRLQAELSGEPQAQAATRS